MLTNFQKAFISNTFGILVRQVAASSFPEWSSDAVDASLEGDAGKDAASGVLGSSGRLSKM